MRTEWVAKRETDRVRTQMHYARKGIVTEEMEYVAQRENASRRNWSATKWRAAA